MIVFEIPSDVRPTIRPLSPLPTIIDPTNIDAQSQPFGRVELDGSLAGDGANGIVVTAGDSQIVGLTINRFSGSGIVLAGAGGNRLSERRGRLGRQVGQVLQPDPGLPATRAQVIG